MLNDAVNDGGSDGLNDGEKVQINPSFLSLNFLSLNPSIRFQISGTFWHLLPLLFTFS